jgi:hypothetical protein
VQIFSVSGDKFLNMERALKAQALSSTDMTGNGGLIGWFQQAQQPMSGAQGCPSLGRRPLPECPLQAACSAHQGRLGLVVRAAPIEALVVRPIITMLALHGATNSAETTKLNY